MTLADVRLRLGVSRKTVVHLIPKLRGYKVGRVWRFDSADVEAFISTQKANQQIEAVRPSLTIRTPRVQPNHTAWPGAERYQ